MLLIILLSVLVLGILVVNLNVFKKKPVLPMESIKEAKEAKPTKAPSMAAKPKAKRGPKKAKD